MTLLKYTLANSSFVRFVTCRVLSRRSGNRFGSSENFPSSSPRTLRSPLTKGRLARGPWEQIFYGEFDGRRRKRVLVKIIGE